MAFKKFLDKETRRNIIKEILEKENIRDHKDIIDKLKKEGYTVSQPTVSRDIKELGYKKNDDGVYVKTKAAVLAMKEDLLFELISHLEINAYLGIVSDTSITFQIPRGYEDYISNLMYYIFKDKIIGIIPGYGTILVLTENDKHAKDIFNFFGGDTKELDK